jgi:plasmid stabilization system protein ParE
MAHRLSPEAETDLDEIWFYIAINGTVDAADRFVDALTNRFFLLATHTRAGRARDELAEGLRIPGRRLRRAVSNRKRRCADRSRRTRKPRSRRVVR